MMDLDNKAKDLREAVEAGASTSDVLQVLIDVQAAERERCASMAENYDLGTPEGHAIAAGIRGGQR